MSDERPQPTKMAYLCAEHFRETFERECAKAHREGFRGYVDGETLHDEDGPLGTLHVVNIVRRPLGAPLPAGTVRCNVGGIRGE